MQKGLMSLYCIWIPIILLFGAGCAGPRSIVNSGKVTPTKHVKAGLHYGFNLATEPLSQLDDISKAAIDIISKRDTVFYDDQIDVLAKAMTAYALDPVGSSFDFLIRYGFAPRFDAGYRYASGVHALDVMYQFMGPTGTPNEPGEGNLYGSIGLQYSSKNWDIIDKLYLDKVWPLLKFTANKKDITVPVIFSYSFGPEEEIGAVSWGLVYSHSFVKYGFEPGNLYKRMEEQLEKMDPVMERRDYSSFGAFVNLKIGFKYVYLIPAFAMYYQDYGTYRLLDDKSFSFSGMTFIPSIGFQFHFNRAAL